MFFANKEALEQSIKVFDNPDVNSFLDKAKDIDETLLPWQQYCFTMMKAVRENLNLHESMYIAKWKMLKNLFALIVLVKLGYMLYNAPVGQTYMTTVWLALRYTVPIVFVMWLCCVSMATFKVTREQYITIRQAGLAVAAFYDFFYGTEAMRKKLIAVTDKSEVNDLVHDKGYLKAQHRNFLKFVLSDITCSRAFKFSLSVTYENYVQKLQEQFSSYVYIAPNFERSINLGDWVKIPKEFQK